MASTGSTDGELVKLKGPLRLIGDAVFSVTGHRLLPRPQEPRSRPYRIEEVRFGGGTNDVVSAGELTMPRGDGPFAAAILISGSGPQDRDESIAVHKPFLVLSDHLTRHGYAVLRTDDRGVGKSTGDRAQAGLDDLVADAAAAHVWLSTRPDIDSARMGFLSHSEGGYIAPAAARRVSARFMVFLAGPAKPLLPDVMDTQIADIARSRNVAEEVSSRERLTLARLVGVLESATTPEEAGRSIKSLFESSGSTKRQVRDNVALWGTRWAMDYVRHDPLPALRGYSDPVLALYGGNDLQVSAAENSPPLSR